MMYPCGQLRTVSHTVKNLTNIQRAADILLGVRNLDGMILKIKKGNSINGQRAGLPVV
jgi:hypothetical protein